MATKTVRGPRAHVLWRDPDKLSLFSLVETGPEALWCCLQMFEGQTKMMIAQNSSWSYQLIQQATVATNCSLGLFVFIPKFCLRFVSLSENRNLLFPFSAVLSPYAIWKNAFRTEKNAAVQCVLIKMRAYVDTKKFFPWSVVIWSSAFSVICLLREQSDHCVIHTWECALTTVLIFAQNLSMCCQILGDKASFPCFGLLHIKIKCAGLVRSFLQTRRKLVFSKTKS